MKLKSILLVAVAATLMVVLSGCGGESQIADTPTPETTVTPIPMPTSTVLGTKPANPSTVLDDGDRSKGQGEGNRGNRSELENWRELYKIPYTVLCIDKRLGTSVTREFQTGNRGPTDEEMKLLEECDIESPRGPVAKNDKDDMDVRERIESIKAVSGGWIRTGDPKKDQYTVGYVPTGDEWRCGVEAVGVTTLRNIKAGKHSITDEENQKLTPCFRVPPKDLTHPYAQLWEGHCIPLDLLLEVIDYYRPSWEQLECHLEELERYELPTQVRYLQLSDPFGIRTQKSTLCSPLWDRIMTDPYFADLKLNFSPSMANMAMPPSYDEQYNSMNCLSSYRDEYGNLMLDPYWLDEAMRGATVGYIIEKKKGRRIYADTGMCSNAYIVQGNLEDYERPPINSVEDFKEIALNVMIPRLIIEAKTAEKVKAEMMQVGGLQAEVEVIFSKHEFLWNLPSSEQLELAQWFLDISLQEVRKYFNGMLWVTSAANFDSGHQDFPGTGLNPSFGPHWKNISYAAADHVSFTLSTSCDFAHLERYLDIQIDTIMEIVQRDNVTWGSFPEISKRHYGPAFKKGCKDEFNDREVEMWQLYLSKLDALPVQPYFLSIPPPPRSWTIEDEGYSPTEADDAKGDWQLFSLDVN